MKVGILGLPSSGKTTLFNLLTGMSADTTPFGAGKREVNLGSVKVPDVRIEKLAQLYEPKKVTYTEISFVDLAGLPKPEDRKSGGVDDLIPHLRDADALAIVLRGFHSEQTPPPLGKVSPVAELDAVRADLIVADLGIAEKKLDRLEREKKSGDKEKVAEYEVFRKLQACLEEERFLSDLDLEPNEEKRISGYGFLTLKGFLLLQNCGDDGGAAASPELEAQAKILGAPLVAMNTLLEQEVAELPEEERSEFCESLGIEGGARDRFIRAAYESLKLISFFTAGPKEVRAWTVTQGSNAQRAAGKIHTDLERGFIRAEVIPNEVLIELGSEKAVKDQGKMRLEGRDYIVQDGDVIVVRFSA